MSAIAHWSLALVWEQFDAITQVLQLSKKEDRIVDFWSTSPNGIEYRKDAIGNVVMRKIASPGFKERPA